MRKRRWIIAALVPIVAAGVFIARHRSEDPLSPLNPYVFGSKWVYYTSTQAGTLLGKTTSSPMEYRYVAIRDPEGTKMFDCLNAYVSQNPGWTENSSIPSSKLVFESFNGASSIRVLEGSFFNSEISPDSPYRFMIEIGQPMSAWDTLVVRLKNIGRDPFDHSHDMEFP